MKLLACIAGILFLAISTAAQTDRIESVPDELAGVGITEHLDTEVPKELVFKDQNDREVRLGDYFTGERPVILTLNYSNCPMLCHLQLNGFVDALKQLQWELGTEFDMVTISIDPTETPQRARLTKNKYAKMYGRPGVEKGWHFLVGPEERIKAVADAVGFQYTYNEARDEYVHAAAAMICTPDGHVSRYLYGVIYEPQTIKFALLEAAEGTIGSTMDQVLLYCFHYDADAGRYAPAAINIMRLGGLVTVVILGTALGVFWRRDVRRKKQATDQATS